MVKHIGLTESDYLCYG